MQKKFTFYAEAQKYSPKVNLFGHFSFRIRQQTTDNGQQTTEGREAFVASSAGGARSATRWGHKEKAETTDNAHK